MTHSVRPPSTPAPSSLATVNHGETLRASAAAEAACRREGEYWTIEFGGRLCRLRDAKGLYGLAHLLLHPRERVAAVVLLMQGRWTDRSAVVDEPWTDSEVARVLVTKRIRAVVKKIEPLHPSLAHHLDTCIKTGALCVYLPDPESRLRWDVRL
jgi:hypothetical protein